MNSIIVILNSHYWGTMSECGTTHCMVTSLQNL